MAFLIIAIVGDLGEILDPYLLLATYNLDGITP